MRHLVIFVSMFIVFLLIGCSSGKSPINTVTDDLNECIPIPVYVSEIDVDGNPIEGTGTLGLFEKGVRDYWHIIK